MIVCPRCSHENEDSAMNCANCHINLQWALENLHEAVPSVSRQEGRLGREEGLPEARGVEQAVRLETRPIRGFLVIVSLLAAAGSLVVGCQLLYSRLFADFPEMQVWIGLLMGIVGGSVAAVVLLRREPKPDVGGGLRLLALIALVGGLGYGLMRLTLVILPEHTGRSLTIQYKLGERDFRGANLEGGDLRGARLGKANLSGANLGRADLRGADLGKANLRGADLSWANLGRADLIGANLQEADLRGADLRGAILWWPDLRGADLGKANLSGADLRMADLSGANLWKAELNGADLRGADLSEADLRKADLRRADLTGATVTNEQLAEAESLEGMILPDGSMHE